ncbi:heterokaryon incompatibility protein-domain-containing protein, partial [Rhypophila decipiens]
MRLINTTTLQQRNFLGKPPPYAILSHTWGEEEVAFKDFADDEARACLQGWTEVVNCCQLAAADGWEWVWIDTCCSDSAELSEVINSMFRFYEEAHICYAYLADVPLRTRLLTDSDSDSDEEAEVTLYPWALEVENSRYFKRGWTLQELLAPSYLVFLDQEWGRIGTREEFAAEIYRATAIHPRHLVGFRNCSVAVKLSWAAYRKTTRAEDRAYSMLGLLGINMPLLYGEGKKAVIRLQQELIRSYNDEIILAWGSNYGSDESGTLAPSLDDFSYCSALQTAVFDQDRQGFTLSNVGLVLNAEVFQDLESGNSPKFSINLNCT